MWPPREGRVGKEIVTKFAPDRFAAIVDADVVAARGRVGNEIVTKFEPDRLTGDGSRRVCGQCSGPQLTHPTA